LIISSTHVFMMPRKILIYVCLVSSAFYALETSLVDKKLPNVPPMVLTFWSALGITLISGFLLISTHKNHLYTLSAQEWGLVVLVTLLFFGADYTHFYVLHLKAGAVLLSTTYLLIPIIASIVEMQVPSMQIVLAWIFGFVSLLLLFNR
jgi:drug/metabolite transporter (DMT)-like permease